MRVEKVLLVVAAATAITGSGIAQTSNYRQQYPLPASTSVTNWAVNGNFEDLPDEATLTAIEQSGAKLVRCDMSWTRVESIKGSYKFTYYDALVTKLKAHDLRPIFITAYTNKYYNGGYAPSTDESRTAFVDFVTAAVSRYKGRGFIWEVWNEPNEDRFWKPYSNVDDYARLALLVGQSVRRVAPEEWLIGPACSGFDWPFLERCFKLGVLEYFDAVSVHPYRSTKNPETVIDDYDALRGLIDQYRPANKPIGIINSEWGYSLMWTDFNEKAQAKMIVRSKLVDMLSGIRVSNTFGWRDLGEDRDNKEHWFGLNGSRGERDSGRAFRTFNAALRKYRLVTRLDVGSPNDYVLLFASGNAAKLVAWTTDRDHNVALPASPGTFEGMDFRGEPFNAEAASSGLTVTLSDEPVVLRPISMNPLLRTATGWGRLPSWAYAGDAGKLAKMVGPVLVSPSWKNAPAGTTLIVKDTPAAGELFSLKPYEGTLVGLNALTADSAAVKQVLASLPRPIDVSEGARTLRVTLRTPDGATATQTADFYHPTPMRLTLLSPRDNQLTVRVENVNGAVFQGELRAEANGKTCVEDVSFAEGETTRTITMTELTKADMPYGFKLAVSPLPGGASGSTASELASATILMTALADPVSGEYSAKVESDDRNPGQVSVTVGSAPSSPDFSAAALTIDYWIATGRKAVILQAPASITSVVCPGTPSSLGMWVYGDGSKNILRTRFIDETDQVFQATYGAMTWTGWKYIQFPLNGTNARWWGGSNDGRVRGSIRILAPLIIDSQRSLATHATVYVGGMTLISTTP